MARKQFGRKETAYIEMVDSSSFNTRARRGTSMGPLQYPIAPTALPRQATRGTLSYIRNFGNLSARMDEVVTNFELTLEPDSELAEADTPSFDVAHIRQSKIISTISRARYGTFKRNGACLLTFESNFIPYYDVRFKYVEVELRLVRPGTASIVAYEPHQWQGNPSTTAVQQTSRVGIMPSTAKGGGIVDIGINAGYERQSEHAEVRRAWLESELEPSIVKWRLSENDVTREGVPRLFQGALIIAAAEEELSIRLKYSVKLSKSADPRSWRSAYARTAKALRLDRTFIGEGIGPSVNGIDDMDSADFRLDLFATTTWDM